MQLLTCSQCGRTFSEFEFVETIEEYLCESCASGIEDDESDWDDDDDWYDSKLEDED